MLAYQPTGDYMKQRLADLATEYEYAYFDRFPELGLFWGRKDVPLDRFTDNSLRAIHAWEKIEDDIYERLLEIDEKMLFDSKEHVTYQLLKQRLEANRACRVCKDELWTLDPLFGWHIKIGLTAEKQPLGTAPLREAALTRYAAVPKMVQNEINNLSQGIEQGYTAPKPVVERIINQLQIMLAYAVEDAPIYALVKSDQDQAFAQKVEALILETINPALQKFHDFLSERYLPCAREAIGLSNIPEGVAGYEAKIMRETTLNVSPEEVFEFGQICIEQIQSEIKRIGSEEFGIEDVAEIFKQINTNPKYLFETEQEVLDLNMAALDRVKAAMENWFDYMPKADCKLVPYPEHRAKTGSPGEYHPPSEDGTRPGVYYINTFKPHEKPRADQEATLFHELIPGHHYQVALAQEDTSHHTLDKFLWNSGFGEGWALYTERLADEMGLYSDNISVLGLLSNESLRAARLVVDPGIHHFGWTREKALDYLKSHTAFPEHILQSEVDRYIMLPGQATSYMLGQREIFQLRDYAIQALGEEFDIRDFHHQVLKDGAITLPMLRNNILDWVESLQNENSDQAE